METHTKQSSTSVARRPLRVLVTDSVDDFLAFRTCSVTDSLYSTLLRRYRYTHHLLQNLFLFSACPFTYIARKSSQALCPRFFRIVPFRSFPTPLTEAPSFGKQKKELKTLTLTLTLGVLRKTPNIYIYICINILLVNTLGSSLQTV